MKEDDLLTWVLDVARMHGWRCAHFRPALTAKGWRTPVQGDGAGFPDALLLHPTRGGMALELKSDAGRVAPEQHAWLEAFERSGWVARVVRPRDRDEILALLSGGRAA